jgi:Transposase
MDSAQPRVRVLQRRCTPLTYPCPRCGTYGHRKDEHTRRVRDIAYQQILILEITVGEYRAGCACCKTFRSTIVGIEPRAEYSNRVREAVIDRLLDDSMNMERLRLALQRDFHLDLSDGFLYDCLDWKVRQVDMPGYRQWTLTYFSGTLSIDEIHLGHRTLLLATDPLGDFPVAFALVRHNDQSHMRRFLNNLKSWGFLPQVVITDGSNLYPTLLAELWSHARHQLCIFHVLKDINECVFAALRRLRRQLLRPAKRSGRRGRLSKAEKRARKRAAAHTKKQVYFLWKQRHLLVSRPEQLSGSDRRRLTQMYTIASATWTLRHFALQVYRLFDVEQSPHQARCRWAALVKKAAFQADPDLTRALAMLPAEKFQKMIAYLHSPAGRQVRTNNHVERVNRRFRYLEKVRYKWRRRRTIVRFVVLALDRWRQRQLQARAKAQKAEPSLSTGHQQPQQSQHRTKLRL